MTSLAPAPSGTDLASAPDVAGPPPDAARAVGGPRIWLHLGLLVLVLAAVLAVARPGVATWDEGSYGSQADLLREEGWLDPYRFADIDPSGRWYPVIYTDRADGGWAPYTKHPLVPGLQSVLGRPLGRVGYAVPSVLGVLGAAATAWAIARRIRPGTEVVAFWIIGSGPLVFHASIIWAHSVAAAFGGLAVLGAVLVRQRPRSWAGHLALAAGGAGLVLVRSEGLLMALALVAAVGLDALLRPSSGADGGIDGPSVVPPLGQRLATGVGSALPAFVVIVATFVLEQRWIASILGSAPTSLEVKSTEAQYTYLGGRLNGLWASTLAGSDLPAWAPILSVLLLALVLVVAARRRIGRPDVVVVAIGAYAFAMAVIQFLRPPLLVTGLLPAWPLMTIGVVACGSAVWRRQRLLALASGLTALAIWATQYADGGVFQWGGRFFMVIAVPLAVIAADGVRRLLDEAAVAQGAAVHKTALFGAVVALGIVSAVAPVVGLRSTRLQMQDTLGSVEAASGPVAVTTSKELPRLMWRSDIDFLRVDADDLDVALERLRGTGLEEVSLIATEAAARTAAPAFGEITGDAPVPRTDLRVWTIEAADR